MSPWRQLRAIALLPGMAVVVVPALILILGDSPEFSLLRTIAGALLIGAGFAIWLWTVRLFAAIGRGTLAPWDPTQHLVAEGPYAHMRNPMITALLAVLVGEALLFGSTGIAIYAAGFLVVNHLWFVLAEEPASERRLGAEYTAYKERVPRWIPRP